MADTMTADYAIAKLQETHTKPFFLTVGTYAFVNMGMVSGILPVVGVPLPLISFGGTSMVTMLLGFGILMSVATHRRLVKQ